ncbi:hypothetical protein E2C01_078282 [Portunus trituberculatus]|uniref:Uncharacterized protein n=1 Tax=Portunus trituberculatus TaxID=210409 RepID=A0A5B7IGK5_PORTR|nr:hypothetical protein [Portunus trituberculatus]
MVLTGVVWCCLVVVLCSTGVSAFLPPASRNTPRPGHFATHRCRME